MINAAHMTHCVSCLFSQY